MVWWSTHWLSGKQCVGDTIVDHKGSNLIFKMGVPISRNSLYIGMGPWLSKPVTLVHQKTRTTVSHSTLTDGQTYTQVQHFSKILTLYNLNFFGENINTFAFLFIIVLHWNNTERLGPFKVFIEDGIKQYLLMTWWYKNDVIDLLG